MAIATLPLLSHQELRHLVPGLSPAAARRMYHDPHDKHWQAFSHDHVDQFDLDSHVSPSTRRRKIHRSRQRWSLDYFDAAHDGRELAADPAVALPGDAGRNKPRLGREEAFRAPELVMSWAPTDFVDDDADLYRLGLLYEDEHVRGPGFGLDAIVHAEPAYSVRPAKRARRHVPEVADSELSLSLVLDLSHGEDVEAAQFIAPDVVELKSLEPEGDGAGAGHSGGDENVVSSLSVIYELPEGASTRSLEPEAPADIPCFPSLISDLGDGHDWALLDKTETETSSVADAEADASTGAEDSAMSATGGPWIMLGDDS
ncbi:hypothetical protein F5X99DRAFT_385289 [Biscogniauxia marginata]|nr:hypothetical protein F5X99DRAFT_385289 [Biscogniauxia marginata]